MSAADEKGGGYGMPPSPQIKAVDAAALRRFCEACEESHPGEPAGIFASAVIVHLDLLAKANEEIAALKARLEMYEAADQVGFRGFIALTVEGSDYKNNIPPLPKGWLLVDDQGLVVDDGIARDAAIAKAFELSTASLTEKSK